MPLILYYNHNNVLFQHSPKCQRRRSTSSISRRWSGRQIEKNCSVPCIRLVVPVSTWGIGTFTTVPWLSISLECLFMWENHCLNQPLHISLNIHSEKNRYPTTTTTTTNTILACLVWYAQDSTTLNPPPPLPPTPHAPDWLLSPLGYWRPSLIWFALFTFFGCCHMLKL